MKRGFGLSLLVAAMVFAYTARAEERCTKIVATGHPDYPVMAFREGSSIGGAAPLLVGEIAEKLQIPLESKYMGSWSEAQSATRAGKADMIMGVYYNEERNEYLEYVKPPYTIRSRFLSQTTSRSSSRATPISLARRVLPMKVKVSERHLTPSLRRSSPSRV